MKVWRISDKEDLGYVNALSTVKGNEKLYKAMKEIDNDMVLPHNAKFPKGSKFAFRNKPNAGNLINEAKKAGVQLSVKTFNVKPNQINWGDRDQINFMPVNNNPNKLEGKK